MLSSQLFNNLKKHLNVTVCSRNIGVLAPAFQKATDPIQQLFIDKLREYRQKSGGSNKLVEASPQIEQELKNELEKIAKQYGDGQDINKFPSFKFQDPPVDSINLDK